ncbi:MAG: AAA family ATPase [Saprospiraceae bacterium]
MEFERDIIKALRTWAQRSNRKPLVLRGARQVGKTTAVRLFGKEFDNFVLLNLERSEDRAYFTRFDRIETAVSAIFFDQNIDPKSGRTLLFIDEIQAEPKAVFWLRYFYEQFPYLYVIAAGSLLETLLEPKNAFPVGRVEYLVIRPVSFSEFLRAIGETAAANILEEIPLPEFAVPKLFDLFHIYALIGGMPEIVQEYAINKDLTRLKPIYNTLLTAYQDDVQKYASGEARSQILQHCIRNLFLEAGGRIKFQGFGHSNYGSRETGEALRTLEKAMLCHLVFPATQTTLPPLPDLKRQPYLQVLDTGLMNFFCGLQQSLIGTKNLGEAFQGKVIHHWVGQQILANFDSPLDQLNFWVREKNQSSAEVDFVLPFENRLVPVEVKSGKSGKMRALQIYMDACDHDFAVRLFAEKIALHPAVTPSGKKYSLLNLPYFLGGQLNEYLVWMKKK